MKRLLITLFATASLAAQVPDLQIAAPAKRAQAIEQIQKRLATAPVSAAPDQKNPFSLSGFEAVAVVKVDETKKDAEPPKELLQMLAEKIEARARVVVNGEPMLLTAKQRLTVGSKVPVTHEGLIYELEITSIEIARFTVRYKTEEYTRSITQKPTGK